MSDETSDNLNDIAVVGMEIRVPGATTLEGYWQNVRNGVESVRFLSNEAPLIKDGLGHVKAVPGIEGIELFDAGFFGFNPREAEVMDPQLRLFLECAWAALETAGYDALQYPGRIGVFAGCSASTYMTAHVLPNIDRLRANGALAAFGVFNDRDALATLTAYKFDLTGPAVTVQSFCSTSLVAVHMACQSLLGGESDMVLAGAASINVQIGGGYMYQEGGILSVDGHTRTFDEKASGTVFGNGVGVVVLKRMADALAAGDTVHAVIRGSAINNDGSQKAGYTAPSVVGQSRAIAEAMAVAGVDPESISYVEAHGTATALGDPIEIEALTRAFRTGTQRKGFCAIGSVKTNFGHLDRAAGVAALVKTALMLKHRELPPLLHFEKPSAKIDFDNSPFVVNKSLRTWDTGGEPRRAGISSLGVGGTNAHVILEEAPPRAASGPSRSCQLLVLSARTETALDAASLRLAQRLKESPEASLADTAFTLLAGRRRFEHRRVVVAESAARAAALLESLDAKRVFSGHSRAVERPVVFLFPGQGAQYAGMTRGLYESEKVYRDAIDACAEGLRGPLGLDLRTLLFPKPEDAAAAGERLKETALTQPALFAVEYALAQQWIKWGVTPSALLGHSIGEYVAATLAGVMALPDALALVAERGRLMQSMPAGSMLAVALPEAQVLAKLHGGLALAAANAPGLSVVAGPTAEVDALEAELTAGGAATTRLHTSHAFHSAMMEPILPAFRERVARVSLKAPQIPFVSNVTGAWITEAEATSPDYWAGHLRGTVRFSRGVETLLAEPDRAFLEVGPGNALSTLVRQHRDRASAPAVVTSVRHAREEESDLAVLLGALGKLWLAGVKVPASGLFAGEKRQRAALPTYPFERERYWIESDATPARAAARSNTAKRDPAEWFYVPSWRTVPPVTAAASPRSGGWLLFVDPEGHAERLAERLRRQGDVAVTVRAGKAFDGNSRDGFVIDPASPLDYEKVLKRLGDQGKSLGRIVHAFAAGPPDEGDDVAASHRLGYYSLVHLARALAGAGWTQPLELRAVTRGAQVVLRGDAVVPARATALGVLKVLSQEQIQITCAALDVDAWPASEADWADLEAELRVTTSGESAALRGGQRFVEAYDRVRLAEAEAPRRLREKGVYLITGGLGGVAFVLAASLAHKVKGARLVLTGRARMPERGEWDAWRATRGDLDPVSLRILRVQSLEQLGAEVLLVSADAGDEAGMRHAVEEAERRFGALHGVIHGAGIVGGSTFRPLDQIGVEECEQQFHPKVAGLQVLDRVLGSRPLDFCMLTSSLSSVLGGFGYGAYAPANIFMDVYTKARNRTAAVPWMSVNWDEWRLVDRPAEDAGAAGLARFAMSSVEGAGAFLRLLEAPGALSQVVVSTGDLGARIDQWVKLEALHPAADAARPEEKRHPRPQLQTAYVAPGTDAQRKVAAVWADLLGIEKVGIQDNFFDLGGHSLLAIQVVTRLKQELAPDVSIAMLFEGPTVESLCRLALPAEGSGPGFDQSSDRGRKRKEERQRRQAERVEETP